VRRDTTLDVSEAKTPFGIDVDFAPRTVSADPEFQVFRRLHDAEVAPTLSGVLGAKSVRVLIGAETEGALREALLAAAHEWAKDSAVVVVEEKAGEQTGDFDGGTWYFGEGPAARAFVQHDLPPRPDVPGAFVAAGRVAGSTSGRRSSARKAVDRVDRAQGAALLEVQLARVRRRQELRQGSLGRGRVAARGARRRRRCEGRAEVRRDALSLAAVLVLATCATLRAAPPKIAEANDVRGIVAELAADAMRGRGAGSPELAKARDLVRAHFEAAGLKPGLGHEWLQPFEGPAGEKLANVVGRVDGTGDEWLVVGAHYDHLGTGEPGSENAADRRR
jgi:hypothetical protein